MAPASFDTRTFVDIAAMGTYNRRNLACSIFQSGIRIPPLFGSVSHSYNSALPTPPSSDIDRSENSTTNGSRKSTSSVDTLSSVVYSSSADFSNALITVYNAAKPSSRNYTWCPVFKQYLPPELIDSIHIIPTYVDPDPIGYLFGSEDEGSSHIHSLSNGLILAKCVAELLTRGDFAIIPASAEGGNELDHPTLYGDRTAEQGEWRAVQRKLGSKWRVITCADGTHTITSAGVCIDESAPSGIRSTFDPDASIKLKLVLMKPWLAKTKLRGMEISYADLHNTVLEFKSSFRPDMRYLYYHYVTSILRWLNTQEAPLYRDAWRPKERWLRESLIVELARPGRLANWEVYEEIIAGRGMFDESDERDKEWIGRNFQTVSELGTERAKVERMAMRLSFGLLVLSE
ncbi:hypothetical protein Dda_3317 [Drechslerella dactyloides]|uniref:HNH nuclease domain-containing protein n=1 Tax=Drechslerella dactyloides TaxID=74499 RepID=A0AAD6NLG0_DREDA|nr:hypothetical protein Dda_3317 [Drechslerella dactyloides]